MNPEASRCLLCKKPKCAQEGCPVHTPVPECMSLYREGRIDEAGALLFRNNPLSAVTSQVCDWQKFCYGHCVLNVKKQAVRWYEIEQELSSRYLFSHVLERHSLEHSYDRVAIVGAGPAGIAAAIWLYQSGAEVTMFDANPRMGGVLRYGIPPFRLDRKYCDAYEKMLLDAGVEFRENVEIGKDITIADLSAEYDAVLVAAGAEYPSTLGIPGEARAVQALGFLKNPSACKLGRKVIVIGGGNVAMDACRTAVRMGAETWVYYRKTFENMPANPLEVQAAKADGVQFKVFQAPVEVKEGGVVFCDCKNVIPEDGGRVITKIIKGTEHFVECDTLLVAVSEKPDPVLTVEVQPYHNVFLAGDFMSGPATVVEAVRSAHTAVENILESL